MYPKSFGRGTGAHAINHEIFQILSVRLTCRVSLCFSLLVATSTTATTIITTPLITDLQVMTPKDLVRFVHYHCSLSLTFSFTARLLGRSLQTTGCDLHSYRFHSDGTCAYHWIVCIIHKSRQNV